MLNSMTRFPSRESRRDEMEEPDEEMELREETEPVSDADSKSSCFFAAGITMYDVTI